MENRYLFRGKRINNGEWVVGDLVHSVYRIGDTCVGQYENEVGIHEVDPNTVCQSTGFEDVRGQIIWENDIVLLWDTEKEGRDNIGPYVVRWSKEHGKFEVEWPCCYTGYYPESATKVTTRIVEQEEFDFSGRTPQMVVIGNTIDNDELRKMDWEEAEAMLKERKGSHDGE